jgi:hypothetical protein
MKRTILSVFILLCFCGLAYAQDFAGLTSAWKQSINVPVRGGAAAGGGSQYYYPTGKTASNFTSDDGAGDSGYALGSPVVANSTGTYTKVGFKIDPHGDSTSNNRICVYNSDGSALLVGTDIFALDGTTGPKWFDITISQSITSGTVAVLWSTSESKPAGMYDTGTGYTFLADFFSGCPASVTLTTGGAGLYGARLYK